MADGEQALWRHAEPVMGTVVSFAVRTGPVVVGTEHTAVADAVARAVAGLREVDEQFSPYRAGSEVARIADGSLALADASAAMVEVLRLSAAIAERSDGYFTTRPWGRFDPSGLVKGWAVERAARLLRDLGFTNSCVSCGGDVQMHGTRGPGQPWTVGIVDPHQPQRMLAAVDMTGGAVATSGTAERGYHVVDPHTGRPPTGLASVTVVGEHLTTVDACATAAFAMGRAGLAWLGEQGDLEGMAVDDDGRVSCTEGWPGRSFD